MSEEKQNLIPRSVIFGNPDKVGVKVSPNGNDISFIAPHNGVLNIFLAKDGEISNAKPITNDTHRGIREYFWTYDSQYIIYSQDQNGNENNHLYRVNLQSGEIADVTPMNGAKAGVGAVSKKFSEHIIVMLNDRRPDLFDPYLLNVKTGELVRLYENDKYMDIDFDEDFQVRFASVSTANGGITLYKFHQQENSIAKIIAGEVNVEQFKNSLKNEEFMNISPEDVYTTHVVGFSKEYNKVYMLNSVNKDKAELVEFDVIDKTQKSVFKSDKADVKGIMQNPQTKEIEAVAVNYLKDEWTFFDSKVDGVFKALQIKAHHEAEVQITSRSLDDKTWIAALTSDKAPPQYYRVNSENLDVKFLFSGDSKLEKHELAEMHPMVIKARDGLELVSYLTLPKEIKAQVKDHNSVTVNQKVPLVLYVHGGPTARDEWGLDKAHQWLSDRGYAVLSVNYRGSTGFGKNFIHAGNGEWSRKMHDDLIDAANWAVAQGITSQDKIGIMGGSYGGYAALVGLTFTPEFFQCAVDIVGPSNLVTLLESVPAYWKPFIENLNRKTGGNTTTEEGKKELLERSPITRVEAIKKPLLIGQGANDPRVKQAESDQIVKVMNQKNIPVIYALYPDEGHGFARPENRMSFFALTEYFLHQHLGGRFENITENDLKGSSIKIESGMDELSKEIQQVFENIKE